MAPLSEHPLSGVRTGVSVEGADSELDGPSWDSNRHPDGFTTKPQIGGSLRPVARGSSKSRVGAGAVDARYLLRCRNG
jgi:hypothetical protein